MSNAYTNSPACILVATHCAACGKPLVDAISVECAVGPDCRRKHGYNEAQLPADFALAAKVLAKANVELDLTDSHRAANKLVWLVAVNSNGALVACYVEAIAALGFVRMAKRIAKRLGAVEVESVGSTLRVSMSYEMASGMIDALRRIPGRVWDREEKVNVIPATARVALWQALRAALPRGTLVVGASVAAI